MEMAVRAIGGVARQHPRGVLGWQGGTLIARPVAAALSTLAECSLAAVAQQAVCSAPAAAGCCRSKRIARRQCRPRGQASVEKAERGSAGRPQTCVALTNGMPAAPESFVVCVPLLKRPLSVCARQNARSRKADSSVHGKSKQTQRVYSSVQGTAARAASQLSTHAHGDAFVCPGILRTLVQRGIFEEGSGGLPLDTGGLRKISHQAGELAGPPAHLRWLP